MEPRPIDEVRHLIRRLPGWADASLTAADTIIPLEGGITNRNFLVRHPPDSAVVRIPGRDTDLLGIDRFRELEAALQAASLGIGPEVFGFLLPEKVLVTRFVAATPVVLGEPDTLARVVQVLRIFHGARRISGEFDPFAIGRRYAATARERGVILPPTLGRSYAAAFEAADAFAAHPDPPVPTHNDLLPANFLQLSDGRVLLIDYEYAGMGSRWFDLGNLSANNQLDAPARTELVRQYSGKVSLAATARVEVMMAVSDFREGMWALIQQSISGIDFDYRGYAELHLDRLLTTTTTLSFRRALDIVHQTPPPPLKSNSAQHDEPQHGEHSQGET